jgi:ABC-type dipeptide/oligopeptide/nickel transport system permease component
MRQYVLRRVLLLVPTLLVVYTITFGLMHATPGGPWDSGSEKPIAKETVEQINKAYGLDKPLYVQYVDYLWKAVRGDFGPSYTSRSRTVTDIVKESFPVSIKLGLAAMALAILLGIPLGIVGALKQNTFVDYLATFTSIVGISTPSYVLTTLLVLLFAVYLHLVPTQGWEGVFSTTIIIPAVALALGPAAFLARYTRSSMLDVVRQDYIRTARAKGLSDWAVVIRHAVRNALIPLVTVMAIQFGYLVGITITIEFIFAIPGMGTAMLEAVTTRDFPVIQGFTLFMAIFFILANLVADLLYAFFNPKIRYGAAAR